MFRSIPVTKYQPTDFLPWTVKRHLDAGYILLASKRYGPQSIDKIIRVRLQRATIRRSVALECAHLSAHISSTYRHCMALLT